MKNKDIKIAIVSPFDEANEKISLRLSEFLRTACICAKISDNEYQMIYNKKNKNRLTSNEIHTMLLAKFHSRIKAEKISGFVSNGSVLNDLIAKRQEIHQRKKIKYTFFYWILGAKFREFEKKVEKLIEDYAETAYDKIYFLKYTDSIQNESFVFFENNMLEILDRKNIPYTIIYGSFESFLGSIVNDLNKTIL